MAILNEHTNTVTLSGHTYPIRCDLYLLEVIQEKYGDISDYEYKLIGFVPERDECGDLVINDAGNTVGKFTTPDLKVVSDTLFLMINEGLEFAGDKPLEDEKQLKKMVDVPLSELADILHDEYMSCFRRKNRNAMQNQETAPEK